jgi:hypothetical protein
MNREVPFDSIESAHQFVELFVKAVFESKRDIDTDVEREKGSNVPRRLEALQIVAYKLEALELCLTKSRRILNDLRSLRRLLFDERASGTQASRPKSSDTAKPEIAPSPSLPVSRSSINAESAVAPHASAYAAVRKRAVSSSGDPHVPTVVAADAWYVRPEFKNESMATRTGVLCDTNRG